MNNVKARGVLGLLPQYLFFTMFTGPSDDVSLVSRDPTPLACVIVGWVARGWTWGVLSHEDFRHQRPNLIHVIEKGTF